MKKRIYTYYKGYLECQYAFTNRKSLGKRDQQFQHSIELQPRFRFHKVANVSEEEYKTHTTQIVSPHIRHSADERVEFLSSPISEKPVSVPIDEILMIMQAPGGDHSIPGPAGLGNTPPETPRLEWDGTEMSGKYTFYTSNIEKPEGTGKFHNWDFVLNDISDILNSKKPLPLNAFLTQKGTSYFGRFHGFAYCRSYEITEVPDPILPPVEPLPSVNPELPKTQCKFIKPDKEQCSRMVDAGNDFCFQHRPNITPSEGPALKEATEDGGCFGKKPKAVNNGVPVANDISNQPGQSAPGCFNKLPGPMGPAATGCFNSMGCFSPMMRWIAAIGSLLIGLSLLALAWCFIFGDCGKNGQSSRNGSSSKQDTVYVEVFRELKDTLKIVKMDTVAFVDSTIKSQYEMVSLPNVQFYTDSDILLPSSARELQQLAEYLAKNEKVNATILGHTDNTGDPKANLDLSKRRAESVKRFLQSLGVNQNRLQSQGFGDKRPKADNNTKEGRLMNRRVEVQLITEESTETKRTQVPRKEEKPAP